MVQCLQTEAETPINKERGGTVMTDQLYGYLLSHTQEHEVLCSTRTALHLATALVTYAGELAGTEVVTEADSCRLPSRCPHASITGTSTISWLVSKSNTEHKGT